ncbi:putative lipoprotein [Legionella beliardensis]|uniref:Putative lipoprotein n=1 Tax=Legionella beliardensis TaxID=91822 RepID=A0A378JQP0_9GAMM|nr:TIGR03751 family conjugal transfer lipoprotein [Legionella beliardensis]STX55519.1 putative lipoprotein [Legionella beliardensis]
MVIHNTITAIFLCVNSLVFLSGCSKNVTAGGVPEAGLTVSQIYHQSMAESMRDLPISHHEGRQKVSYEGYVREAHNEVQTKFKTVENPAIPIFIYPHVAQLGDEQLIKPGFTSEFFLYKQNQFALASERY